MGGGGGVSEALVELFYKKGLFSRPPFIKALPEAQRTHGIELITQIILMTKLILCHQYLKEEKSISFHFVLFVCLSVFLSVFLYICLFIGFLFVMEAGLLSFAICKFWAQK